MEIRATKAGDNDESATIRIVTPNYAVAAPAPSSYRHTSVREEYAEITRRSSI